LGSAFSSRVVHVPVGGRGGVKRNHIYYSHHLSLSTKHDKESDGKVYPTGSAHGGQMYCREDQNARDGGDDVEQITTLVYYVVGEPCVPTWCFPPDFYNVFHSSAVFFLYIPYFGSAKSCLRLVVHHILLYISFWIGMILYATQTTFGFQ
jgi:hypothetical protein